MNIPILFLPFNRPEVAKKVFEIIRQAKPTQLFIAADGPRINNTLDKKLCSETRKIFDNIDWECEVKTLFRNENLGCKYGINAAIDWFFEHVDKGIILEDDCLPDPSFFSFCEEMLIKYENNEDIGLVSGNNYLSPELMLKNNLPLNTYYFVKPVYTWGWATWKRAWAKQDLEMLDWPKHKKDHLLERSFTNKNAIGFFSHTFDYVYSGRAQAWDVAWFLSCLSNSMMCIIPPKNLISNIGVVGAHSKEAGAFNNLPIYSLDTKILQHPSTVTRNIVIENITLDILKISNFSMRRHLVEILHIIGLHQGVRFLYKKLKLSI